MARPKRKGIIDRFQTVLDGTKTLVDDQITRPNIRSLDQPSGPTPIELVPSPAAGIAGHGTPSSPSSSRHSLP